MRCFIALELPGESRRALAEWSEGFRSGLSQSFETLPPTRRPKLAWTRPEGYHLTLAFLGEIEAQTLEVARASLDSISQASGRGPGSFGFRFSGLGGFPQKSPWRILYAGLVDEGDSADCAYKVLNRALAEGAREAALPSLNPEWRPGSGFTRHITVARVRGSAPLTAAHAAAVGAELPLPEGSWRIGRCVLYESELRRGGSVYTELSSVDL
jgi:2''-5'' RNA ligase